MKILKQGKIKQLFAAILLIAHIAGTEGTMAQQTDSFARQLATRTQQTHRSLAALFSAGSVEGRFLETTPGRYSFTPSDRKLPVVNVANPSEIASQSVDLKLKVRGDYDPVKWQLAVTNYSYDSGPTNAAMDPFTRRSMSRQITAAIAPRNMSGTEAGGNKVKALDQRLIDLEKAYSDALKSRNDEARNSAVAELAKFISDHRRQPKLREEFKAIYGAYDNYPPWSYERIHDISQYVVAIGEPQDDDTPGPLFQSICSGVRIARDLVLTAGHCFEKHLPTQLEVWFGFTHDADLNAPKPLRFKIVALLAPGPSRRDEFLEVATNKRFNVAMPDFAIVQITDKSVPGGQSWPNPARASCQRNCTGDNATDLLACRAGCNDLKPEKLCLRKSGKSTPLMNGQAVYVIGFPRGERQKVHDNGRIYLPYRILKAGFNKLSRRVEIDLSYLNNKTRIEEVESFKSSYIAVETPPATWMEFRPNRANNQPRMGIAVDTFKGNSGSPVLNRVRKHCIVGILVSGAPDTGSRLQVSWELHEGVLPMSAIQKNLLLHDETKDLASSDELGWK